MNDRVRLVMVLVGLPLLSGLLLAGTFGLPRVGGYHGVYGARVSAQAVALRHVTDVVTAVNFDFRGFDTLGEEFILFTSVIGVAMLLRSRRGDRKADARDRSPERPAPETSNAVRLLTVVLTGVTVVFGFYVVLHGAMTPGGGFQGGVILATAPLLVYLAGDPTRFRRVAPPRLVEAFEAVAAFAFVALGLPGLLLGRGYLANVFPMGRTGDLLGGGTIPWINFGTGIEVAAGFVFVLHAFLHEALRRREEEGTR